MTAKTIWELPVPPTAIVRGPDFSVLPRRGTKLEFSIEGPAAKETTVTLRFDDVVAYRCTYLPALTATMVEAAYGKLVDLGATNWLTEVQRVIRPLNPLLRHLMICFDDGPCYELICESYLVADQSD